MLFGTPQRLAGHRRNHVQYSLINSVTEYVYLGNLVDNHLSLSSNFERVYRKACGRLRLLVVSIDHMLSCRQDKTRASLSEEILQWMLLNSFIKWRSYQSYLYSRVAQLWKPVSTRPSFSCLHQLRERQVVSLASLLIESLKPSNITSQLWSANVYVMNLTMKSWIIILKLKIIGKEREIMNWSLKWLKSNLKRRDLTIYLSMLGNLLWPKSFTLIP